MKPNPTKGINAVENTLFLFSLRLENLKKAVSIRQIKMIKMIEE